MSGCLGIFGVGSNIRGIKISEAPYTFRSALEASDENESRTNSNDNGVIDNYDEASGAALDYCKTVSPVNCQFFLNYLEREGYHLPALRLSFITNRDLNSIFLDLRDVDKQVRWQATKKLLEVASAPYPRAEVMGQILTMAILRLKEESDPGTKMKTAELVGKVLSWEGNYFESNVETYVFLFGDATDELIEASKSNDAGVRWEAVGALGEMAKYRVRDRMADSLIDILEKDQDAGVRMRAAEVVDNLLENGTLPDCYRSPIINSLINALKYKIDETGLDSDENKKVNGLHWQAALSLGEVAYIFHGRSEDKLREDVVTALRELSIKTKDEGVRTAANEALAKYGE